MTCTTYSLISLQQSCAPTKLVPPLELPLAFLFRVRPFTKFYRSSFNVPYLNGRLLLLLSMCFSSLSAQGLFPQIFLLIVQVVVFHFACISPLDMIPTNLINRFHCNYFSLIPVSPTNLFPVGKPRRLMPYILSCYPRDGQRYFIPLPPPLSKEKKIDLTSDVTFAYKPCSPVILT